MSLSMFHFISSVVESIEPTSGSPYGGQSVTVTGTGFGSLSNTRVEIGGNPCDVKSIEPTEVICTTRAKPENQKFYPGE